MLPLHSVLRQGRESAGLTQEQVSKEIGVHRISISRFENGKERPSPRLLKLFRDLYDLQCSMDDLLVMKATPDSGLSNEEMVLVRAFRNGDVSKGVRMFARRADELTGKNPFPGS